MSMRPQLGLITFLAVGALAIASVPAHALNPPYDPITLTCLGNNGSGFVEIGVKAGNTGAPAGFTLQWMTLADWEANGEAWFSSDDPRLCKMSFSGQPSFSGAHATLRWELGANDEVVVRIGDQLFDETGVSGALADDGTGNFTQPDCALKCGVDYVFRTFAHASRFNSRSAFSFVSTTGSPNLVEPGEACGTSSDCGGCTLTQGFWKNHGPGTCSNGNNNDAWNESIWPGGVLTLGTVGYTPAQICAILHASAKGNGLIALAHQLIAAKLNALVNGVGCASADIATADALIGGKVIPPVGSGTAKPNTVSASITALDNFNNGLGCAAHCTRPFGVQPVKKVGWGQMKVRYR